LCSSPTAETYNTFVGKEFQQRRIINLSVVAIYMFEKQFKFFRFILNLKYANTSNVKITMTDLAYISPFFIVSSLKTSISFYVDKLGFEVQFIGPDGDPYFAIVGRDHVSIMLKEIAPGIKAVPNYTRHEWARWDAYISASEPDALFKEYSSRSVAFRQPIHDDDDGLRGFEITDADGYVLFFGRPKS
jgi:catechol 2,3-dioxygenase-like lactoylglutathione lyase family enzyme